MIRCPTALLLAAVLSSPASASPDPPPSSAVYGRYVLLASDSTGATVAYARLITDRGYSCPQIVAAGGSSASAGDAKATADAPSPIAMSSRDNPYHFPVVVCEARIGAGLDLEIDLADGTLALPTVGSEASRVLVFGDSGCKLASPGSSSTSSQDGGCPRGAPAQPFATLAAAAASAQPDLLLHMGDYNYRGTPGHIWFTDNQGGTATQVKEYSYDAGDGSTSGEACEQSASDGFLSQSAANSNYPDSWEAWRDDFFAPAGDLLAAAPWVFARGNHELCSRAGPGWFYFLDPSTDLDPAGGGQRSCPEPVATGAPIDNVVLTPPYAVAQGDLTVVVVDSANACDSFTNPTFQARYDQQAAALPSLVPASGTTWLMSHRPMFGVTEYDSSESTSCTPSGSDGADTYGCINQTLQTAIGNSLGGQLPGGIELLLAGHMHRFQALTFNGGRPPMVVVGTSGVALDGSPPTGSFSTTVDGDATAALATGATLTTPSGSETAFGYLEIDRTASAWSGKLINAAATGGALEIAKCGSAQQAQGSVCALEPGIQPAD